MAGYKIVYTIDDKEWEEKVRRIDFALHDMRPALKDAGEYMRLEVDDRFKHERDMDGVPWKPISPETIEKKRKSGDILKILQEAGNRGGLRKSIAIEVTRASLSHGTNKIYGAIHQLGGEAGRGHAVTIDARPYLGYSKENLDHIADLLLDHVDPS